MSRIFVLGNVAGLAPVYAKAYKELGFEPQLFQIQPSDKLIGAEELRPFSPRARFLEKSSQLKRMTDIEYLKSVPENVKQLKRMTNNRDLIHLLRFDWLGLACILSRRTIIHLQGAEILYPAPLRGRVLRRAIVHSAWKLFHNHYFMKKYLHRTGYWLRPPVDLETFRPTKTEEDLHNGFDHVILCPSRPSLIKRLDLMLRDFSQCKKGILYMLDEHGDVDLRPLIHSLRLKMRVRYFKWKSRSEIAKMINASDVVIDHYNKCFPSFNYSSLESMACNKPTVVWCDAEGYREKPATFRDIGSALGERAGNRNWVQKYHDFGGFKRQLKEAIGRA